MADPVTTFDPGRYRVIFRGRQILQLHDGTFIKVKRDVPAFKKKVGGQGTPVRVRSRNKCGMVTVTTQQTSPSNDELSDAADLDELEIAAGVGELLIVDLNGTTVVHAQQAWVEQKPDLEVADDLSGIEWNIDCGPMEYHIGGALGI